MSIDNTYEDRLLASYAEDRESPYFLTVAIPHYKNPLHLKLVIDSLAAQTFDDFEILISDDKSPDDSNSIIPPLLEQSGRPFRYYSQPVNLGYDGNVRFCLGAAKGRYVMLLGNDDALDAPLGLQKVARQLHQLNLPEIAFVNFEEWATPGSVTRRATGTRILGSGVEAATQHFRSFSFVSGLIYDRAAAARHETDKWDRSIYYQIYIACRILAAGGRLGSLDVSAVRKDVRLGGETVENYLSRWGNTPWSFTRRHTGLDSVIRVTADAVLPLLPEAQRSAALRRIATQVLTVTYPFWLFEYRRIASWSFAVGIARGLWPGGLLREYALAWYDRLFLWMLYFAVTAAGLSVPSTIFGRIKNRLADFVRRILQPSTQGALIK